MSHAGDILATFNLSIIIYCVDVGAMTDAIKMRTSCKNERTSIESVCVDRGAKHLGFSSNDCIGEKRSCESKAVVDEQEGEHLIILCSIFAI